MKCNHDRELLREVVAFGKPLGYGLEAGSKPELLLAASLLMEARSEGWLVCNGYKDAAYVDAALLLSQLHPRTVLVIEKPDELQLILRVSHTRRRSVACKATRDLGSAHLPYSALGDDGAEQTQLRIRTPAANLPRYARST